MNRMIIAHFLLSVIYVTVNAVPLTLKIVDLTHAFDKNTISYPVSRNPSNFTVKVEVIYPHGIQALQEDYSSSTHAGTHIDAPSHFFPGATTVDKIPLDQLTGPAAVVDITARASLDPDAELLVEDLVEWEITTGQTLNDTIVLMRSGYGKLYGNKTLYIGTSENDYTKLRFPGISPEAALWMVTNRRVKGAGVDSLSFDRGQTKNYLSHRTFLGNGRFILENVANLENVPEYGAILEVTPMKIANAGGAPARIKAIYPEVIFF